jgi:NAD(P)H-flavin reductase
LELRGPIGGPFTWRVDDGGPLLLVADGSGLVPLMAMLRHRAAKASTVGARLLISTGSPVAVLYRSELMQVTDSPYIIRSRAIRPPRGEGSPGASTLTC